MNNDTANLAEQYNMAATGWHRDADLLSPVTTALASWLGPVAPGGTILDVACGRGEPGLSLIEATPQVSLVGVDIARAMVEGARADAAHRALTSCRFDIGSAEDLPVDTASVQAVVSRMGMLGFPDSSPTTASEAFRVLRPGGRLAIAVWGRMADQTALAAVVAACREVAGGDAVDLSWMDVLGDGRRERWLEQAGFSSVSSESITWMMRFADWEAMWETVSSAAPLSSTFSTLTEVEHDVVRERYRTRVADYQRSDGSYSIPVSARVIAAVKRS